MDFLGHLMLGLLGPVRLGIVIAPFLKGWTFMEVDPIFNRTSSQRMRVQYGV